MPPAPTASARPSRSRSTAVTMAASPDASFWLIVAFGPHSLYSSPASPAAALPTVLLKSKAGAPDGPPRNKDSRYSLVACPPALYVPSTIPARASPSVVTG